MANQTGKPDPGDVADGRGHFAPDVLPGEPEMDPDDAPDAAATHGRGDQDTTCRQIGTRGAAIEDLADPTAGADANAPDPSRPVAMAAGPGPGHGIPGGVYGDSRAPDDPPIRDDDPPDAPDSPVRART